MKVTGFTFIRNAVKYDYPVVEAIKSILPLCDAIVVAVGKSEDQTRDLVTQLDPKVRILDTVWDDKLREGGRVLAQETNKALKAVSIDTDWCFYIQGDEVIHEKYLPYIKSTMEQWKDDEQVEGIVFNYTHFYGSYEYVADSKKWYRREVRIIRKDDRIYSYKDAQGFQKRNRSLRVKPVKAFVYHYGWVKHPRFQQAKQRSFNRLWHSDEWVDENIEKAESFDYSNIDSLRRFEGTHPEVMRQRIEQVDWEFSFRPTNKAPLKPRTLNLIERMTGWRIGEYQNFKII